MGNNIIMLVHSDTQALMKLQWHKVNYLAYYMSYYKKNRESLNYNLYLPGGPWMTVKVFDNANWSAFFCDSLGGL